MSYSTLRNSLKPTACMHVHQVMWHTDTSECQNILVKPIRSEPKKATNYRVGVPIQTI